MKSVFFAILLAAALGGAQAQTFPSRPMTFVVPYPAGGTAYLLCRFAADRAGARLGQQIIVENRPGGAGGRIGVEQVLHAPADGYTLLCAT
jgi:tripartite-type tricarboxylate transporter receptor subunit TctC